MFYMLRYIYNRIISYSTIFFKNTTSIVTVALLNYSKCRLHFAHSSETESLSLCWTVSLHGSQGSQEVVAISIKVKILKVILCCALLCCESRCTQGAWLSDICFLPASRSKWRQKVERLANNSQWKRRGE